MAPECEGWGLGRIPVGPLKTLTYPISGGLPAFLDGYSMLKATFQTLRRTTILLLDFLRTENETIGFVTMVVSLFRFYGHRSGLISDRPLRRRHREAGGI